MGQPHTPPCCWDRKPWSFLLCNGPGGKQESQRGPLHKGRCEGDTAIQPLRQSHRARLWD